MANISNRTTIISGVLVVLLAGALLLIFAPTDANALNAVSSIQVAFTCDDPIDMTVTINGYFNDNNGGYDNFSIEVEDGDGDTIYNEAHSVTSGSESASIYISRGDMDHKPDENPIEITVFDGGEEEATLEIDSPCLEESEEAPNPEEAETGRGVYRLYANYQDTILYYPGEEGGLEVRYVSPDGVGLFVGRFPKEQLNSSQEPSTTPIATWTWDNGWLSWSLYYIGGGQYQVNHYIGGVLNFEYAFTP